VLQDDSQDDLVQSALITWFGQGADQCHALPFKPYLSYNLVDPNSASPWLTRLNTGNKLSKAWDSKSRFRRLQMVSVLGDSRVSGQWQLLSADNNVYTTAYYYHMYLLYLYLYGWILSTKRTGFIIVSIFFYSTIYYMGHIGRPW